MSTIGVISDTHNYFDPAIPKLFAGVAHIIHGGDIGLPWLLLELEQLAPVTAVLGNTDDASLGYRLTEVVRVANRALLAHHIVNPYAPTEGLAALISRERPDAVLFGHTHKPFCETLRGTLFLNPGYAGKTRFGLERSVALLHCEKSAMRVEFLKL